MTHSSATRACIAGIVLALTAGLSGQQKSSREKPQTFGVDVSVSIVRLDLTVRDKAGNIVRGLGKDDFTVAENGKPQEISTVYLEELHPDAPPSAAPALSLTDGVRSAERQAVAIAPTSGAARRTAAAPPATATADPAPRPETLPGRRLVVLLFDTGSMQPEEVDRAIRSATEFVDKQMAPADVVAVTAFGQALQIVREFTVDKALIKRSLAALDPTSSTGADALASADTTIDDSEFGIFNNDRRLRAIRLVCDAMAPLNQRKALMYFSSGMARSGTDNNVQLRQTTNACNKANTSIYTVDSRGLQTVVAGGDASQRGAAGADTFSGAGMMNQFSSAQSSKETLSTLATDTGGSAYLDANDFAPAFAKVQKDISAYYLIGYESSNPMHDGKYRRISVKLKGAAANQGYTVEARPGYYAGTDFAHLAKNDRERQLEEQISAAISSTDLPVVAVTSWFRYPRRQVLRAHLDCGAGQLPASRRCRSADGRSAGQAHDVARSPGRDHRRAGTVGRQDSRHHAVHVGAAGRYRRQEHSISVGRSQSAGRSFQGEGGRP